MNIIQVLQINIRQEFARGEDVGEFHFEGLPEKDYRLTQIVTVHSAVTLTQIDVAPESRHEAGCQLKKIEDGYEIIESLDVWVPVRHVYATSGNYIVLHVHNWRESTVELAGTFFFATALEVI